MFFLKINYYYFKFNIIFVIIDQIKNIILILYKNDLYNKIIN